MILNRLKIILEKKFFFKEYEKFINLLNHKISIIINRNVKFQKIRKFPNYNKLLLTEQTTLIYRFRRRLFENFRLYNNYQDDDKKFIIDDLK